MLDVLKRTIRSLGIKLEDVEIRRTHVWLSNGVYRIDNSYSMLFLYENRHIEIELAKLNNVIYMYLDGVIVDHHVQELADITAEELYKIIKEFINRNIGGK